MNPTPEELQAIWIEVWDELFNTTVEPDEDTKLALQSFLRKVQVRYG